MSAVEVVYRDAHYVAIDKPSGVIVHRESPRDEEAAAVQLTRDAIGQWVYPVHRLDRGTSGVLVFGLTSDAASRLAEAFRARDVRKEYVAIVRGFIDDAGTIDSPLARDREADAEPRDAITDYARLGTATVAVPIGPYPSARYSLVSLRPRTGRTHQLRRHMAHVRHPIVGDVRHGDGAHNRLFREHLGCRRLCLWATALSFRHPFGEAPVQIRVPPRDADVLRALGWSDDPTGP